VRKKISDNGKPGENRGRKANGSKVTKVTTIARPPKIIELWSVLFTASLDNIQARRFSSKNNQHQSYRSIKANPVKTGDAKPMGLTSRK
jgi:hypothetical protein